MAKGKKELTFARKRELLYNDQVDVKNLVAYGEEMLEDGLFDDALAFFIKADEKKGIERVVEKSRRKGDFFSFEAALRALGRSVEEREWKALGDQAMTEGLLWFAHRAYERAGSRESVEKVRARMEKEGIPTDVRY